MEYRAINRYKRKHRGSFINLIKQDSGILYGISIPFVIATAISVKNAAAMSFEMLAISIVAAITAYFTAGKMHTWVCYIINAGVCTVAMMLTRALITTVIPDITNYLGIYIYLMALNGIILMRSETWTGKGKPTLPTALRTVLIQTLFFSAMMLVFSAFREYFGNGTLWGEPFAVPLRLSGIRLPFFGFIMMGFSIAVSRYIIKRITAWRIRDAIRSEKNTRTRYRSISVDVD